MRELRSWGIFLLPNTDFSLSFCKGFTRQMQMGSRRGLGKIEGQCYWWNTISDLYKSKLCTERSETAKGAALPTFPRTVVLICPAASCSAHHLQALYASATQQTPSAPFNDFCLMNFSVFIKGDAVTRDSLEHTHPYNLYQAPSHNHSGSAPNITQALQNWGFAGSRLLILS